MTQLGLFDPEEVARDRALDNFEASSASLVARGRAVAIEIARRCGVVTSPQVMRALQQEAAGDEWLAGKLAAADPRWLGAVFRSGWIRSGWSSTGSHKRPVPIWKWRGHR